MEDLSGSCADHLIPKLNAAALTLIAGLAVLGPADVRAEAQDVLTGESPGFASGVAGLRSGVPLPAAHWPSAKASAASRDSVPESWLLAAHWPSAKAFAASRDPFRVPLLAAWHVLVHYEDAASAGAERERWDDRAWVFEREGDRLRWTEYPIVVFDDETGRFEKDGANRASRIPHHWRPDEAQLADIENGLAVNQRGMVAATLRRSAGSWVSETKRAAPSASMIRYVESWRVDPAAEGPIFVREDALRSERVEDLIGVTIYTTRAVSDDGRRLRGDFERDGTQHGTFTMTRAAGVHGHGD
jgi:hypothetical protein